MPTLDLYQDLVRPLLFRLPPDTSHDLAHLALRWPAVWRLLGPGPYRDPRLVVDVHGVRVLNPVGLAPGMDKDCDLLGSTMHLGFGFLAPGSIMGRVRAGNPRPRLGRIVEEQALLNCMGLPSKGVAHSVVQLQKLTWHRAPIFADAQGESPEEIVANVVAIQPYVEALEVSLVCPNTHDTDVNGELRTATELVKRIAQVKTRPLFAKIPVSIRFGEPRQLATFLDACIDAPIEGVVASGANRYKTDQLSMGIGQRSGKPAFPPTLDLVRKIADHAQGRLTIIGSGGVFTGRDAFELLRAGASLVEILSAFIYRGWKAPRLINQELVRVLAAEGVESVQALIERRPNMAAANAAQSV